MAEPQFPDIHLPDAQKLAENFGAIAERSQKLVQSFLEKDMDTYSVNDPGVIAKSFMDMTQALMADPGKLMKHQMAFWQDYMTMWQASAQRMMGQDVESSVKPERGDRRFKDDAWTENAIFDFIKQSYLLTARSIHQTVSEVEGLDKKTAEKVDFYTRQYVDAMAPTNFLMTNPQVLRATVESGGENLVKGLKNLLDDLARGKGQLRVKMTDLDAFKLGENVAATPGKVVYQNELMQLIQYTPSTEKVLKRPLLIVPPWINKFYILDLRPKNSFIKWAVDQGLTVFVVSWVNPNEQLAEVAFDDYMLRGPLTALDMIEKATGVSEVNAIGYCIGGTLLASTLAYMAATDDKRIKSATFFTTMLDFSEVGELSVFIDEEQLSLMEQHMARKGYLEGSHMASAFNMLRANDLIWSFVVKNYLLGEDPFPFDLLYWNSDSTRMPRQMHSFYLRNMYQNNKLREPGGIKLAGEPIDLSKVKQPAYFVSTHDDHIAPWKSTYDGARLLGSKVKFILGGSGHIAGVINPPSAQKYGFWTNSEWPESSDDWFANAQHNPGSWWGDWFKWVKRYGGAQVKARTPGDGELDVLEDAPGSYVKARIDG